MASRCGARAARSESWVATMTVEPCSARQILEQVDDLAAGRRVEVAGRLVGEHDTWLDRERPCDRDPLLLAARQMCGQVIGSLGEPHLVEQLQRAGAIAAGRDELRFDVLDRGQRWDEVELLEDETEGAQAQLGEIVVRADRRGRRPRTERRPRSVGRGRRGAAAGSSCPSRSGLRARRTRRLRSRGRSRRARARSSARAGRTW